eukprot:PhF_6_TR33090/c0_g1_i1/m.48719
MGWTCKECENDNEDTDTKCQACDEPRPAPAAPTAEGNDRFKGFVVGKVIEAVPITGKDKLTALTVDVGVKELVPVVTNASNVKAGCHVVVALVGALVNDEPIKKTSVGGKPSHGMVCDAPMLGWTGGGAGAAVLLPESFPVGSAPPDKRPRNDK